MNQGRELARDISAEQPLSPNTRALLMTNLVAAQLIERQTAEQQDTLAGKLDRLEVMLAMSTPSSMDTDPFAHVDPPVPPERVGFAAAYGRICRKPVLKHTYDSRYVRGFLEDLGPTNYLRRRDGLDAAFELGHLAHLLEIDFQALPQEEQRPERRMTEALIGEELALLWAPTIPQRARTSPDTYRGLIYNAEDPNAMSAEQIEALSEKDRWRLVGAQLCTEAAKKFQAIAGSDTADSELRLEARSRSTDLNVRRLTILAGMESNKAIKQELRAQAVGLCVTDLKAADKAWQEARDEVRAGPLGEYLALAKKRYETITGDNPTHTVRRAMPREDKSLPFLDFHGNPVKLSHDIVEEDGSGRLVRGYQVKAMSESGYRRSMARRQQTEGKRPAVYPAGHTDMVFEDAAVSARRPAA